MRAEFDPAADALYVYIQENAQVARTIEQDHRCMLDLDKDGKVIGLEVLSPRPEDDFSNLAYAYNFSPDELQRVWLELFA